MKSGLDFLMMMSWLMTTIFFATCLNEDESDFVSHSANETYLEYVGIELFNGLLNFLSAFTVGFIFNIPVFVAGLIYSLFKII